MLLMFVYKGEWMLTCDTGDDLSPSPQCVLKIRNLSFHFHNPRVRLVVLISTATLRKVKTIL